MSESCHDCQKEAITYHSACRSCVCRRIARCPSKVATAVIRDLRAREGDEAADALKQEVAAEFERLKGIGQL